VQEQLGLKLQCSGKAGDVLVIDTVEMPSEIEARLQNSVEVVGDPWG
jgi:hypothetical protein